MDKMMSDAHATWDRMAASMAPSACQMPAAGIPSPEPFTAPVSVERPGRFTDRTADDMVIGMLFACLPG
jgi:hypothetical protein